MLRDENFRLEHTRNKAIGESYVFGKKFTRKKINGNINLREEEVNVAWEGS